jgi:hypothetical protein
MRVQVHPLGVRQLRAGLTGDAREQTLHVAAVEASTARSRRNEQRPRFPPTSALRVIEIAVELGA